MPDGAGIGSATHGQAEGVQNDGFSGAGLAGQCGHALAELEFHPFSDGVIGNRKLSQHADNLRVVPETGKTLWMYTVTVNIYRVFVVCKPEGGIFFRIAGFGG
jgi:hypothetical protein